MNIPNILSVIRICLVPVFILVYFWDSPNSNIGAAIVYAIASLTDVLDGRIARKYNINPELLSSLNGLNMNDYIYPGQTIMIPKSGYSYYLTKEGDTLDTVANTFGISVDSLLNNNKILYLLDGQLLVKKN